MANNINAAETTCAPGTQADLTSNGNKLNTSSKGAYIKGKANVLPLKGNIRPSFDELLEMALVRIDEMPNEPPICFEFISDSGASVTGTYGNISAIIGKAKSRKTFLVSLVVSAFLTSGNVIMNKIRAVLPKGKSAVLLFDTEQSRFDVWNVVNRILKTAHLSGQKGFFPFCLRPFEPRLRLALIKHKIINTPDASLVVIDGVRDLVYDINDNYEATKVVSELLKLSEELAVHIIVVIHQNKGDNNARGHIGTEIVNKAESIIQVSLDPENKNISIVEAERCRKKVFEPFAFHVDEQGIPEIINERVINNGTKTKKKGLLPHELSEKQHKEILQKIFKSISRPKFKELEVAIKLHFHEFGISFGTNKALEFLNYFQIKGWIEKNKERLPGERYDSYRFT